MMTNREINGTDEIGLVTPTPDVIFFTVYTGSRQFDNFQCNRGDENFVKMTTLPFQWSSDFHDVFCTLQTISPQLWPVLLNLSQSTMIQMILKWKPYSQK